MRARRCSLPTREKGTKHCRRIITNELAFAQRFHAAQSFRSRDDGDVGYVGTSIISRARASVILPRRANLKRIRSRLFPAALRAILIAFYRPVVRAVPIARSVLEYVRSVLGHRCRGRKRTSHPAVYPVSLLAALGKAVPALSHRQQWANSEPIMSDHCHVPEPTHVDRAQPRPTGEPRARRPRVREGVVVAVAGRHYR